MMKCGYIRGITLVEVLIVIIVLGIIASVVVPQFTAADTEDKLNALKADLDTVRAALKAYKLEHNNNYPPDAKSFADQMTKKSRADGSTADIGTRGYDCGPYLLSVPDNPYTHTNTIGSGEIGTSGWYYDGKTGLFRANHKEDFVDY